MAARARIERSPGGGGSTVTVNGYAQWVPGSRTRAEAVALAALGLIGVPCEVAREALARRFAATRGRSAEIIVSVAVAEVG